MIYRCNFCGNLFNRKLINSTIYEQLVCPKCVKKMIKHELTLGIGILHYREDDDVILKALKTIDCQKKFNFSNLKVMIVTDKEGYKLNEDYLNNNIKNFKPEYIYGKKHTFSGGSRNIIIKNLEADYIMFLDGDDEFYGKKTLSKIYKKINKFRPEMYCSSILEEQYNGKCIKYKDLRNIHMCHGKAYKRKFLLENKLLFDEKIKVSEDIGFNVGILNICDSILFDNKTVSHKWIFNKDSITRNIDVSTNKLDSYFRCFDAALTELEKWYFNISNENRFVNDNIVAFLYNILYYRVQREKFKDKKLKDYYLKQYFTHVNYPNINFKVADDAGKNINRLLMKNIELFSDAYKKYK